MRMNESLKTNTKPSIRKSEVKLKEKQGMYAYYGYFSQFFMYESRMYLPWSDHKFVTGISRRHS